MISTRDLIIAWQQKAGCMHTQEEAFRRWRPIIDRLSSVDRTALRIAWSHVVIGEGRAELDRECARVISSLSGSHEISSD